MTNSYPIVFSEVKAKVGIDDVARSLGYVIDRKAGVGKYFEMTLGDPRNLTDRIVIKNTPDKANQTFFRRNGSKGDVLTFIRENINSFGVSGSDDWSRVAKIMAKFANMPEQNLSRPSEVEAYHQSESRVFDKSRYAIQAILPDKIPYLLAQRGFDHDTVMKFVANGNLILIRDTQNTRFNGFNIGFPYSNPADNSLAGYEMRGANGFKSKAAGTDSAHSAWIAQFPPGDPDQVRNVYFFESAFDAMAFYQLSHARLNSGSFALVSVGGSFSQGLAEDVMARFPSAKAWDCFDNDLAGQIYSATLVNAADKKCVMIEHVGDNIVMKVGDRDGKQSIAHKEDFNFRKCAAEIGLEYSSGHWKCPANYKDWNDCLLGIQIQPKLSPSKYMRDDNLAKQRQSPLKM